MSRGAREIVWVTGAKGRIAQSIINRLDNLRYAIITTDAELDVSDLNAVRSYCEAYRPNYIINCAGIRRDECESLPESQVYRVNTLGPRNIAIAAQEVDAVMVHISSDDVFGRPLYAVNEFDMPHPLSTYGKSKLAGESFVRDLTHRRVIVRSSWVYTALPDDSLVKAIKAARSGGVFEVPANEFASPTSCATLATSIIAIMESGEYGTFHITTEGLCSRYEFAKAVLEDLGLSASCLIPTYNAADSCRVELRNLMLEMNGLITMPSWKEDLEEFIRTHQSVLMREE